MPFYAPNFGKSWTGIIIAFSLSVCVCGGGGGGPAGSVGHFLKLMNGEC